MTEEEMAKEYVDTLLNKDDTELDKFLDENLVGLKLNEKQAGTILGAIKGVGICSFLAGLKAGKPKWHDLQKAPNDLPPKIKGMCISKYVLSENGTLVYYDYKNKMFATYMIVPTEVIAWCEIPKYTEESE